MRRNTCPSCGAYYNGRKCKNCYYVPFTEEIAHGLHTHEGEPLVIDAPAGKPIPRRYGKRKMPKWLTTILVWILVVYLVPWAVNQIQSGIDQARKPEPVPLPPLASKLWEGEEITVWADWESIGKDAEEIPVWVENHSQNDIAVSSLEVYLGEYLAQETFLFVEVSGNGWTRGYLYLYEEDLEAAGGFEEIAVYLDIYDTDSYDTIALTDRLTIPYSNE